MAAIINTNIASLNLQKSLSSSQAQLNKAMERLSSGLRINNAVDDAAGLAMAVTFDAQIRGMKIGSQNVSDAVSFLQVQESALTSQTNSLQRMRELAVQSLNGNLSDASRTDLNKEFQSLLSEVKRINGTSFNGKTLYATAVQYQIGANESDTLSTSSLSTVLANSANNVSTVGAKEAFTLGATTVTSASVQAGANTITIAAATTDPATVTGSKVNILTSDDRGLAPGDYFVKFLDADKKIFELYRSSDLNAGSKVTLTGQKTDGSAASATGITFKAFTTSVVGTGAAQALADIDTAITAINGSRATIGATSSALDSVLNTLQSNIVNTTAARSRIMDADYAQETSNLTRGQILQQAGTAMLTQANSMPNIVLSLLKG